MDKDQEIAKLKEDLSKVTGERDGIVNELKDERGKKQGSDAKATLLEADLKTKDAEIVALKAKLPPPTDTSEIVKAELAKRDAETAQQTRTRVESKFINDHKEFHPDNDAGGIKLAAFRKVLNKFNTSTLKTEDDFAEVYADALKVMNESTPGNKSVAGNQAATRSNSANPPKEDENSKLTPKEQKLIEFIGWDEKRFLAQKAKRPAYVASLLDDFRG